MSKRKKKEYDDDDGRVISPMNVDGMPWYTERKSPFGGKKKPKEEKPTGKNPRELPRRGREWEGEVEDEDDLENFIAAENRKRRKV